MKHFLFCLAAPLLALTACVDRPDAAAGSPPEEATVEQRLTTQACVAGSARGCVGQFVGSGFGSCDSDPLHGCFAREEISETEAICICGFPE